MSARNEKLAVPSRQPGFTDAQLAYLSDVLGVHSLIIPEVSSTAMSSASEVICETDSASIALVAMDPTVESGREVRVRGDLASSRLICLFHEPSQWPLVGERAEMAMKMILAMKLDAADVLEIEWQGAKVQDNLRSLLLSAGSRPVLLFGITMAPVLFNSSVKVGEFVDFDGVRVMPTYALTELAAQPNLKKATWSHMQQVMRTLI